MKKMRPEAKGLEKAALVGKWKLSKKYTELRTMLARCVKSYLSWIMESNLPDRHPGILVQIGPRSVDDGDVVFLVA